MSASTRGHETCRKRSRPDGRRAVLTVAALCAAALASARAPAQEPPAAPTAHAHEAAAPADSQDSGAMNMGATNTSQMSPAPMSMEPMQGGKAPLDARDPNAYAEGYEYSKMPGLERVDQLAVGKVFAEQVELFSGDGGEGTAWDVQGWYGPDEQKLWVRTEGSVLDGHADATTSAEALWWRAFAPFWATQLGVRQDLGAGAHTYVAAGVQGLAPYWFDLEATAYLSDAGRVAARVKASYEVLLTNRLILTPDIEANIYGKSEARRRIGTGLGNVELGARLRYEFSRKFAPYIGYVWERSLGDTADLLRAAGESASDAQIVAGVRIWW